MQINYTISTVDSPEYKRLVCGRTDDIARLIACIISGHSVALFGERRMGKTSLLYLTRDILNKKIQQYHTELIDLSLKNAIDNLTAKTSNYKAIYLNLQELSQSESEAFMQLLKQELHDNSFLYSSLQVTTSSQAQTLPELFEAINNALLGDERLVILMDEVEVLLEVNENKHIFRNLRSTIQSCPRICLVLAGAESWHKQIKEKTSPLVNNVQPFYLKAPARFPIETYLISEPLRNLFSPSYDMSKVVQKVIEWTECKPCYVQAVCQAILEVCTKDRKLPEDWEDSVEEKVQESVGTILTNFYVGDNLDNISQKILALLANQPRLTVTEISRKLGFSQKVVWNSLDDLERLDKVRKQGAEYRIVGTLIERWGKKTQDIPVKNPWTQRFKWAGAFAFLLLAAWIYFYTNPPLHTFSCKFSSGEVLIFMPSSLEQGETGIAKLTVQNTSQTKISSLTVTFISTKNIEYESNRTSLVKFDSINPGEAKSLNLNFTARSLNSGHNFASKAVITDNTTKSPSECSFVVSARLMPIKKYWGLLSLLLVALSGFFAKPDLPQLLTSIFSGLFKAQTESKS